ncbi:hypothetical protein ACLBWT_05325 [Paenibacillus sp. D51F]
MGTGMKPYGQQGVAVTCRSLEEYMAMFGLSEEDLAVGEIADVAGGASSFAADAAAPGYRAAAFDPTIDGSGCGCRRNRGPDAFPTAVHPRLRPVFADCDFGTVKNGFNRSGSLHSAWLVCIMSLFVALQGGVILGGCSFERNS